LEDLLLEPDLGGNARKLKSAHQNTPTKKSPAAVLVKKFQALATKKDSYWACSLSIQDQ